MGEKKPSQTLRILQAKWPQTNKKKKEKKKGDRAQKGEKEVKDSLYIFESYSVSLFPSFLVGW